MSKKIPILVLTCTLVSLAFFQNCSEETSLDTENSTEISSVRMNFIDINGDNFSNEVQFEIKDGLAIVGGDMIIGTAKEMRQNRSVRGDTALWPEGKISYYLAEDTMTPEQAAKIKELIGNLQGILNRNRIPITLKPYTNEEEPVVIQVYEPEQTFCGQASLGYSKGEYRGMWLAPSCLTQRTLFHEWLHIFGIAHEHQRHDRDSHIVINEGAIEPGTEIWYEKFENPATVRHLGPYDINSIMHYPVSEIIQPQPRMPEQIQNDRFTRQDLENLRTLYENWETGGIPPEDIHANVSLTDIQPEVYYSSTDFPDAPVVVQNSRGFICKVEIGFGEANQVVKNNEIFELMMNVATVNGPLANCSELVPQPVWGILSINSLYRYDGINTKFLGGSVCQWPDNSPNLKGLIELQEGDPRNLVIHAHYQKMYQLEQNDRYCDEQPGYYRLRK